MNKYPIRTATKAIIIEAGRLLVVRHERKSVFYTLPGGGQDHKEDLRTAMKRECMEELGAVVRVKDILMVRDYIASNHGFSENHADFHQIDILFECELETEVDLAKATEQDPYQTGVEWIPIGQLEAAPLYPQKVIGPLHDFLNGKRGPVYLGDIN